MGKILIIVHSLRKFYWWLTRPTTRWVRAIVVNSEGKVLLVQHQYLDGWYIPDGKVNRGEKELVALHRELQEELGIQNINDPDLLGEYINHFEYKKDHIAILLNGRHYGLSFPM